jgi:glucose-6-phosphate 3-dehydrogenase
MLRIGIVGAGRAAAAHMAAASKISSVGLVGLFDSAEETASAAAEKFNCRRFPTFEDLLAVVDAVIVATPNDTHARFACEALKNDRSVLCEKPMATTADEAERMVKQAALVKAVSGVGFNYRYFPAVRIVTELIHNGVLGELRQLRLTLCRRSTSIANPGSWRQSDAQRHTGGALGDLGSHLLDLALWLVGLAGQSIRLDSCRARLRWSGPRLADGRVGDSLAIVRGQTVGATEFSLVASKVADRPSFSVLVEGTSGRFEYDSAFSGYRVSMGTPFRPAYRSDRPTPVRQSMTEIVGWQDTFSLQLSDWCGKIDGVSSPGLLATFDDGLRTQRLIQHILDATLNTLAGEEPDIHRNRMTRLAI